VSGAEQIGHSGDAVEVRHAPHGDGSHQQVAEGVTTPAPSGREAHVKWAFHVIGVRGATRYIRTRLSHVG
jgi:hypothetical protein